MLPLALCPLGVLCSLSRFSGLRLFEEGVPLQLLPTALLGQVLHLPAPAHLPKTEDLYNKYGQDNTSKVKLQANE